MCGLYIRKIQDNNLNMKQILVCLLLVGLACSIHRISLEKVYKTEEERLTHFKFLKGMKNGLNRNYFLNKYGGNG